MKLENKQDADDLSLILAILPRAEIKMKLEESKALLFACDRILKAINEFHKPPAIALPSTDPNMGKKVVPMKMPKKTEVKK